MTAQVTLPAADRALIRRVARRPATFSYAPYAGAQVKLVRSTCPPWRKPDLRRLALLGYLAESLTGCGGHGEPPETVLAYTVTALGRSMVGLKPPPKPPVHWHRPLTYAELLAQSRETDD